MTIVWLRRIPLAVFILASATSCQPPTSSDLESTGKIWFSDVAQERGINFKHHAGFREVPLLPEINGSGLALVDVDGDDFLDIYFVQSGSLYADEVESWRNALFMNQHDGSFLEMPDAAGAADVGYGMGVATGDYDNDGDVDLFVTNVGSNALLRNDGQGSFTDVTDGARIADDAFSTSASFVDLDNDGHLDLYVANYVNWSVNSELECYAGGISAYCPPQKYNAPAVDQLFRNNGDGTFVDVTSSAGISTVAGHGFGVATADYNDDGLLDVFVATDMTPNHLWINQGNFLFRDEANARGVAVDGMGRAKAGMGVATADPDFDGDFDVLVVNMFNQTDTYFSNEGDYFRDLTQRLNINRTVRRFTRWGVMFADFDNDGLLDLFEANGRVHPGDVRVGDIYAEPNVMFRGIEGPSFERLNPFVESGESLIHTSRGAAVGDIDNDGDLDLVVVNRDSRPYLLLNRVGTEHNWLTMTILDRNGRNAHGVLVTAKIGTRTYSAAVQVDGSFMSSNDPRVHFGVGEIEVINDVRVRWLNGTEEHFGDFPANQFVVLREGHGTAAAP